MSKTRPYFTLLVMHSRAGWCIEFGDYDRETVTQEQRDSYRGMKCKILRTASDDQMTISAAVEQLNATL